MIHDKQDAQDSNIAQVTSNGSKNKEARYEPYAISVTIGITTGVLTSSLRYQSTHAQLNGIYLFIHSFDIGYPRKIGKFKKKFRSVDLRARLFALLVIN